MTSVGLTDLDTYLQITSSCTVDSTLEVDEYGEEYWYYFYPDLIAEVDDIVLGTSIVYQSEASFCVVAGQEILINWAPFYTTEGEFQFAVYEGADITTPVNVFASGGEAGIDVAWSPIPAGCASTTSSDARLGTLREQTGPIMLKNGEIANRKPGVPLRASEQTANNSRSMGFETPQDRRSLQRDCADGTTEVTFVAVCDVGNCYEGEQSYSVVGSDGTEYIGTLETSGSTYTGIPICLADGDYTVTIFDSWGDGWNGATLYAQVNGGNAYSLTMTSGSEASSLFTLNSSAVYGCTDPTALNYNADATDDDGSCYLLEMFVMLLKLLLIFPLVL